MPPKRIGAAAAAAGTPPPPAIDTSMAAITKLETQLATLKPILYSKQNLSDSLRQLHELETHADSIYKANNLGADEEVPAKDVLDAIRAVAMAINASGDTPLLTREQIKASKISEEKQLAAQEAAHRAKYSPTKAPATKASKKQAVKTASGDFVSTAAAVRANIAALSSPAKKGRGAKRARSSKSKSKSKRNPDGSDDDEEDEPAEDSEPELDDDPEEEEAEAEAKAAAAESDDPFAFAEDDAKPAKKASKRGAKLNGTAKAAAAIAATASPAAPAASSSSRKKTTAATSNGHSKKKSVSPAAAAASPRAAAAPAAKKAKTAATTAAASNGSTRTTRSRR